jgi:hypothetical protein
VSSPWLDDSRTSADYALPDVIVTKSRALQSSWIGWDKNGDEVRVPRRLDGAGTVPSLRSQSESPIYVIERDTELLAWRAHWGSTAIVPEDLAKEHFGSLFDRGHLVASEPPMDLVRAKSAKQIAAWNSNICS